MLADIEKLVVSFAKLIVEDGDKSKDTQIFRKGNRKWKKAEGFREKS